jgi:hypothetical protein
VVLCTLISPSYLTMCPGRAIVLGFFASMVIKIEVEDFDVESQQAGLELLLLALIWTSLSTR